MSRVIKINDYKIATGKQKTLTCPRCGKQQFVVVTFREKRKRSVVKLHCFSCKKRLDVMCGFVSS